MSAAPQIALVPVSPSRVEKTHLTVVSPPASLFGPLFAGVPAPLDRVALPDPRDEARAAQRLSAIEPLLHYAANAERFTSLRLTDGRPVTSLARLIEHLAVTQNVSPRTLKRWLALYRKGGPAALADRIRADKGASRWMLKGGGGRELGELAAYVHLRENLPYRMAYEIVKCRAQQLEVPAPSYETIRKLLRHLSPAARTLAKKGSREYDKLFASYIRRGYVDFAAGEILVSDHAIHDVLVQNDLFDECGRELIRLRFTGLEDMRSRRFTAYAWSQEGSSRSITTVLRHHYTRWGRFRLFYCDNGKDYRKVGKGARGSCWSSEEITADALGVLARLDAEIKYCQPFHPQAKLIERANNTIHQRFDRRWSTYCGPTPEQRPERCELLAARHAKLLAAGRVEESEVPLASEFIRAATLWIENEYHRMTKNVEGMQDLTPLEAWEKYRWPGAGEPVDPAALVPLLAERTVRTIHNGRIQIDARCYIAADAQSSIQLHDRSGQKAIVLFDPGDSQWIAATDEDGHLFAYLTPETLLRQSDDAETRAAIAASMQERHGHRNRVRAQLKALDQKVLATGYVPQNNQMLQIGRLPIDIAEVVVHRPKPRLRPDKSALAPASASDIAASFLEEL